MNKIEKIALAQIRESLYESMKEINDPGNEKREGFYVLMPIKRETLKAIEALEAIEENDKHTQPIFIHY